MKQAGVLREAWQKGKVRKKTLQPRRATKCHIALSGGYMFKDWATCTKNNPKTFPTRRLNWGLLIRRSSRSSRKRWINACLLPSLWLNVEKSSDRGKHMPFAPCDKHIKSSSQEKASLLAAVVCRRCQMELEDKTMAENEKEARCRQQQQKKSHK